MKSSAALVFAAVLLLPCSAVADQTPRNTSWTRVERLPATSKIRLTVRGGQPAERVVVGATDEDLMVLNLTNRALTRSAKTALFTMARRGRADFDAIQNGAVFRTKETRVDRDGLFLRGVKVADLNAIVETIARDDVRFVTRSKRNRMAVVGAVAGTAVGFVAGVYVAIGLAHKYCGDSCIDEKVGIGLALAGLPAAGGILGYMATKRNLTDVIYKASPIQEAPAHDDARNLPRVADVDKRVAVQQNQIGCFANRDCAPVARSHEARGIARGSRESRGRREAGFDQQRELVVE